MIRKLLLVLAFAGVASGKMMPPKSFLSSSALSVRGGAEPIETAVKAGSSLLDPRLVANVAMGISLLQGSCCALAPVKAWEMYGSESEVSGIHELIMERIGAVLVGLFLTSYWLISKESSVSAAVGVGCLPFVVYLVKSVLNGTAKTLGYPQGADLLALAITGTVAYLGMTDSSKFGTALKAFGFWNAANCLLLLVEHADRCKFWGSEISSTAETLQARVLGCWMLSAGIMQLALDQGMDSLKALGFSWIAALAVSVTIAFIAKEVESLEIDKIPHCVWMAVELAVSGTLAVSS